MAPVTPMPILGGVIRGLGPRFTTLVYSYVQGNNGNRPPPHDIPLQPSAPAMDDHLFPEDLLEDRPQPRTTRKFYPDISIRNRFRLVKEFLVKKSSTPKEAQESHPKEQKIRISTWMVVSHRIKEA